MAHPIRSLLLVSHFYKLPNDVCVVIFNHIKNVSAQKIIDAWYNHILIQNINPCYLINKLPVFGGHNIFNEYFQYYDLNNRNVLNTFRICDKYLNPRIADKSWWFFILQRGFNGVNHLNRDDVSSCSAYPILKRIFRKLILN